MKFLLGVMRVKELSIVLVTIAAAIYFSVSGKGFNSVNNYETIAHDLAPWAIIAAGEVMLLICGEIDLSAGFTFALAPFVMMYFLANGVPLILAVIGAVLVSAVIGVVNGLIRTVLTLPSFITTLGMAFFLQGMTLVISDGHPVTAPSGQWVVTVFGHGQWSELLWVIAVVAVMQVVLSATRFGISTQATGGNPVGAAEAGIRTNRVKIVNFALTSTFAGLGGILQGFRVGSIDPTNGGFDSMFFAIAAAVIGGTALLGGSGTVIGAFLGALLLGMVKIGFQVVGVSAISFNVTLGIAILVAMALNASLIMLRTRLGARRLA